MALPYKLIKSLTIDGVTQGLDPELGKQVVARLNTNIPTANTETAGASLTITEPGLYLFSTRWMFGAGSTTGTRSIQLALKHTKNGGAQAVATTMQTVFPSSGFGGSLSTSPVVIPFAESEVPATVGVFATSNIASSAVQQTSIGSTKLIDIYNNLGGNTTP